MLWRHRFATDRDRGWKCGGAAAVSGAGAEQRIVTLDGSLTPAQRELVGLLRLGLTPVPA
jgi:hypothetical protein